MSNQDQEISWLSKEDIEKIHEAILEQDPLHRAVSNVQEYAAHGSSQSIFEQAAHYSLEMYHSGAFEHANEETALAVGAAFLAKNGQSLQKPEGVTAQQVASGLNFETLSIGELGSFYEKHSQPTGQSQQQSQGQSAGFGQSHAFENQHQPGQGQSPGFDQATTQSAEQQPGQNNEVNQGGDWLFRQRVADSPLKDGSVLGDLLATTVEGIGSIISAPDQAPTVGHMKNLKEKVEGVDFGIFKSIFDVHHKPNQGNAHGQNQEQNQGPKGPRQ